MPCVQPLPLLLQLALPLAASAATTAADLAHRGPPELPASCGDFSVDEPEACTAPLETFLLQVVLSMQRDNTSVAGGQAARNASGSPSGARRPLSGASAAQAKRGHVWQLSDVSADLNGLSYSDIMPPDILWPNDEPERVMFAKPFDRERNAGGTDTSKADHHRKKRRISKRVFIVLEMVPASALLGLDRLYICDGWPCENSGEESCGGRYCYLGFLKLVISVLAFLHSSRLIPLALLWWFVDSGIIIDNAVRGDDSINIFGMAAKFDEESVEEARKLSLAAAGQFGLELALFLPAIFALLVGSEPRALHQRISGAIEGLRRPPRPQGATTSAIESATSTVLYQAGKADKDSEDVCSICCDVFQENDRIRVLPCKHSFHAACVDRWLTRNATCPLCKGDITCGGRQQEDCPEEAAPETAPEENPRHQALWEQEQTRAWTIIAHSVGWRSDVNGFLR